MKRSARILIGLAALICGALSHAHEVRHTVETTGAVAVRLAYADGKPFAFEAYEAYPEGQDTPAQVGRTDAQGRALFVPGGAGRWRLRAFAADGHGVDIRFAVPAVATANAAPTDTGPNRASLLLFGLSLLLGGFGAYQLWLGRKP